MGRLHAISLCLAVACVGGQARGAECVDDAAKWRDLDGHRFSRFGIIEWPFVSARVGSRTGVAFVRFHVDREVLGTRVRADGDFAGVRQAFEAEAALAPWFALELEIEGTGIFGHNRAGALVVGAHASTGGAIGAVVRLAHTDDLSLVARLTLDGDHTEALLPANLLDTVTVTGSTVSFRGARVHANGSELALTPSVAAAYAPSELVGFQSSAGFALERVKLGDETDDVNTFSFGLGASFDLSHVVIPVSFLVGGEYQHDFGRSPDDLTLDALASTGENRGYAELGVFYIGRANLELGLLLAEQIATDDHRSFARIRLAYFF